MMMTKPGNSKAWMDDGIEVPGTPARIWHGIAEMPEMPETPGMPSEYGEKKSE